MKLKSYMRGLGVGIIVTAILMGIGNDDVRADKNDSASSAVLSDLQDLSDDAKVLEEEMKNSSSAKAAQEAAASSSSSSEATKSTSSSSSSEAVEASSSSSSSARSDSSTDVEVASNDAKASSSVVLPDAISILPKAGEISDDGQALTNKAAKGDSKVTEDKKSENDKATVEKDTAKATPDNKESDNTKASATDNKPEDKKTEDKATEDKSSDKKAADSKEAAAKEEKVAENIDITVTSGQSSLSIAKACENAGLVENAVAFDKYMSEYGYDRKLTTGKHSIPKGSTEAQIASILTGK